MQGQTIIQNTFAEERKESVKPPSTNTLLIDPKMSIRQIQNSLVELQMEKVNLENQYNKIPQSHRKSFAQRDRKNFLQSEIEKLDKQINQAKLLIRRKKAQNLE